MWHHSYQHVAQMKTDTKLKTKMDNNSQHLQVWMVYCVLPSSGEVVDCNHLNVGQVTQEV